MTTEARTTIDDTLVLEAARFVKACSLYPTNHCRVQNSVARVLELLRSGPLTRTRRLVILFRRSTAFVGGRKVVAEHALVDWLLEIVRRARIGGVELTDEIGEEGLVHFARAVVTNGLPSSHLTPIEPGETAPGIRVLAMNFAGRHTTEAGDDVSPQSCIDGEAESGTADALVTDLALDDRVCRLLEELEQVMHERVDVGGEDVQIDLLPFLVTRVLEEDGGRLEDVHDHVVKSLERLVQMLQTGSGQPGLPGPDSSVGDFRATKAAQALATRFFVRNDLDPTRNDENLPSGRPEDEGIDSQLDSLLQEFHMLPDRDEFGIEIRADDLRRQIVSVCIQLIAQPLRPETPALAARRLKGLLRDEPELHLTELSAYRGAGDKEDRQATARIVSSLLQHDLADQLFGHIQLDREILTAAFPDGFLMAIDSLGSGHEELRPVIRDTLSAIPTDKIRLGMRSLMESGELNPESMRQLLGTRIAEVRRLFEEEVLSDDAELTSLLVHALRTAPLPGVESAALRALPIDWVSPSLAASLADVALAPGERDGSLQRTAQVLRDFVRYHASSPDHEHSCSQAVQTLGCLPSTVTWRCLKDVARSRLLGGSSTRGVRRAARQALRKLRRAGCA